MRSRALERLGLTLLWLLLCAATNPEKFFLRPKALVSSLHHSALFSQGAANRPSYSRDSVLLSMDDGCKVKLKFDNLYQKSPFRKNSVLRSWFLIWTTCSYWFLAYYRVFCKIKFIEHSPILKRTGLTSLPWGRSSPVWLTWALWRQSYISTDTAHNHFITWLEVTRTILYGSWHWLCFRAWNHLNILARSRNVQAGIDLPNQISLFQSDLARGGQFPSALPILCMDLAQAEK